jgi:hypothetical protein
MIISLSLFVHKSLTIESLMCGGCALALYFMLSSSVLSLLQGEVFTFKSQ